MADTATPLLDPTGTRGVKFADSGSVNDASPTTGRKKGALGGLTVYSSRWIMLALFCSATMTNAIIWISFAPISANAELFYGVGTLPINGLSMCFMLLYLPGSMLSSYLLERYGLRTGMVVGGAMGCISCWIRYASVAPHYGGYTRYAIVLFGQCIAALAQPIYTNAPAKLAGSWFPAKEREIATTIASILNPVGNAIGSVVPALMVQTPGDMGSMLLMEGILATVTFVPVALWFKSAPPTPPTLSASRRNVLRTQSLKLRGADASTLSSSHRIMHEICMLLTNRNYVLLLCGFGMGLGLFNAIITVIAQLIAPCGYTSTQAGMLSGIIIGSGLFGAAVAGPLMEITKKYRPILKGGVVCACLGVSVFLLELKKDNITVLAVVAGVMGFCMIPLLPVVLENNAELTYPIPEETGSGLLLLNGQVFGIIFIVVLDKLIPLSQCTSVTPPSSILIWAAIGVAVLSLGLYQGQYHRLKHEAESHKLEEGKGGLRENDSSEA